MSSPANILVDASSDRPDHVYLSDFGVSKGAVSAASRTGQFLGTPNYSAPEQARGQARMDGRADQYALACVAYQLLTGEVPLSGKRTWRCCMRTCPSRRRPCACGGRTCPVPRNQVLVRAMAKAPENRYGSCRDFADALREALGLPPYRSRSPTSALDHRPTRTFSPAPTFPEPPPTQAQDAGHNPTLYAEKKETKAMAGPGHVSGGHARHRDRDTGSCPRALHRVVLSRSATRPDRPAASCQASGPADGQTRIIAWKSPQDVECVGYSDSGFVFTNHAPGGEAPLQALQDERLRFDQQQVFQLNQRADQAHENGQTEFSLVYFAGITAGPDENYDSGQAEELEGLMVAQELALQGSGPVFKVIIANGGSKMQDAVPVARMITALAARDPSLLGVVGLDRSIEQVKQAIGLFNASGIPVVATTLSADGIGGTYPHYDRYYFQLASSNRTEADLILHYIQAVVPQYFKQSRQKYNSAGQIQAQKILIFLPSADPGDLFTSTLVGDLKREAPLVKGVPTLPARPGHAAARQPALRCRHGGHLRGRHDRPRLQQFSSTTSPSSCGSSKMTAPAARSRSSLPMTG